jgi:AcrR family transcriptional regulator
MPPPEDSRKRLVQAALKLFGSHGYHNTGIADILKESGVKRGSLYHHFSSKEELGYAAIDEEVRIHLEKGAPSHLQTKGHAIDRLLKMLNAMHAITEPGDTGFSTANMSLRLASVHDGFRKRLTSILGRAAEQTEEVVRRGVADGQIVDSIDPRQLAHLFIIICTGYHTAPFLWGREVIREDARRWLKEYLNSLRK